MIARLSGKVVHKDADGLIVDCHGVGYGVAVSLSSLASMGGEGSEVVLWIHTHVGQDSLRLFGFVEQIEMQAFRTLIGVSGVGPRLALAVLSTFSAQELADVVAHGDSGALVRIPGVGKKKAERLLLELKDRMPKVARASAAGSPAHAADLHSEISEALMQLGFKAAVAEAAARASLDGHPGESDIASLVREALRQTTRR